MTQAKLMLLIFVGAKFVDVAFTRGGQHHGGSGGITRFLTLQQGGGAAGGSSGGPGQHGGGGEGTSSGGPGQHGGGAEGGSSGEPGQHGGGAAGGSSGGHGQHGGNPAGGSSGVHGQHGGGAGGSPSGGHGQHGGGAAGGSSGGHGQHGGGAAGGSSGGHWQHGDGAGGGSSGGHGQHGGGAGGGSSGGHGQHGGGAGGGSSRGHGQHGDGAGGSSSGEHGQHGGGAAGGSSGGHGQHGDGAGGGSSGGHGQHGGGAGGGSSGGHGQHGGGAGRGSSGGHGRQGGGAAAEGSSGGPGHHSGDPAEGSSGGPGHHSGGPARGSSGGTGYYGGGHGHHTSGPVRNSSGGPGQHGGGLSGGLSGGTPDGRHGLPSAPGHPRNEEFVIPRCLLEEVSSLLTEFGSPGSSNVTSYIPRCALDHSFECHQQWPALGLSWRADSQGHMMENTLTKGTPECPLKKVYRKALVCIPGEKIFHCKRGTTLYFVDIKLSRRVAPSHRCHYRGINEDNSTLPNDNRCNATKVIGKIRKRCQGRRECWINLSERHLGKACVREVKFLLVNFTCDQRDNNMTEESEIEEDPMYRRWYGMDDICTDDDNEDTNDDIYFDDDDDSSGGDSGIDSDRDDYDGSGDYNDDDDDDDHFLDENDEDVEDTFDDDVARFQSMGFLGASNLLSGMRRGHYHWGRGRQHCPRVNWLKQPDLYKEFAFNPTSVCPKNEPMQSNCSPNLCKLVKCEGNKNVSCRVNPCGSCRPECDEVKGNRVQSPRALTKCENKRLEIRYRNFDEISAVPKCNEDGSFAEIQCLPKVNKCWCVDEHGSERNGTRQTGKPTNCKASGSVLSSCQSSELNIKNLKEHLSKMAVNYNETANTLKSKAENMTQLMQQQPSLQLNQSRRHIRHQMSRARMCRVMARNTLKMVKHIAELKCTADGNYEMTQCESSGKLCWCVNENGMRVGSMKPLKKLNCSSTVKGRENVCPSVTSFGSGAAQNRPSPCRNDSDCSNAKVCCKTSRRGRGCVDPPPKMPDIKPGKCPEMPKSINYSCASKCKSDADCRGDMKCCGMGCGKKCIPANKPVCPKDKPYKLCMYDKCLSSPGCPSHPSACCRMNYCGGCTAEYFDENDRKIDCSNATQCQKQRHAATENYKRKFLQVYGTMPLGTPGFLEERNGTGKGERQRGNQGGRQEDNQGGRQWNGYGGGQGGRPGRDGRGGHGDGQSGAPGDSQQGENGGSQGGIQSGGYSGAQQRSQSSSGGSQRGRGHRRGEGRSSGGDHRGSRDRSRGRNSGEQNERARGRGRQNRDQRRQPDLGIFIPECNSEDGAFLAEQCNITSGVCWCVDEKGHEKPNTRAQLQRGTRDCSVAITKGDEQSKGVHGRKNKGQRKTKRVAIMNIRLVGNFDDVLKNKDQFINNFKDEVVSVTKVKKEQIQNVEISRGSIKVQFEIVEEGDSAPLEEIVKTLQTVVRSKNFVVKMDSKEYRSDGDFHAAVHNRRYDDTVDHDTIHRRRLSPVEAIAIGSCAAVCLLGTAVFVWKFYFRGNKKEPEGWKDMVEKKPPEVQYYIPAEPVPTLTTSMTPSCKASFPGVKAAEAMPEPSI